MKNQDIRLTSFMWAFEQYIEHKKAQIIVCNNFGFVIGNEYTNIYNQI